MSGFGDHQRRLFRRCLGATGGLALGLAAILAAVLEPAAGESPLFLSTTMFGLLALSVLRPSFDLWSRHLFAGVGVAVITYAAAVEGAGLEAPALFALPLLPAAATDAATATFQMLAPASLNSAARSSIERPFSKG